jgi:hypothetical protein
MESNESDMDFDVNNIIYQKEINIGFFNLEMTEMNDFITKLSQSSFSKKFTLKKDLLNFNEYTIASFEENENLKNEIIEDEEEIDKKKEERLVININNCKIVEKRDEKYDNFFKEKLDFYFIFNGDNIKNYLEEIYDYSKQNYIIFTLDNEKNQELFNSDKYAPNVYDHIEITRNDLNYDKNESKILIFDEFIDELKKKFDLFKIFQKYSIEKSIISFKDYLYNFNKYDKIEDEYTLIDYFNRFEKLSYNNDYADVTIILLQIMITKKNILTSNFTFNVKALKCGFCTAELYESEFIDENKCFYCPFCIHLKNKLQKENK